MAQPRSRRPPFSINDLDLLVRIADHLRQHADQSFRDEHRRTHAECMVLFRVAYGAEHGRLVHRDSLKGMLPFPINTHLTTLLRAGLVEEDDSTWPDKRRKLLRLTPDGEALIAEMTNTWNSRAARAFSKVDALQIQQLSTALRELLNLPDQLERSFEQES